MSRTTNIVKRIERTRRDELLGDLHKLRAQHSALGAEKKRLARTALDLKIGKRSIRSRHSIGRDIDAIVAACGSSLWLSEFI